MERSKIAKGILSMLDDASRKKFKIKLAVVFVIVLIAAGFAHRWESPLAVIPQTALHLAMGYMLLHWQSVNMYPKIRKYFNIESLEKDAKPEA